MPRLVNAVPTYRRHASGQAFVILGGKQVYLGQHGSKASRREYHLRVAEWLAAGRPVSPVGSREITITELCAAFLRHAQKHYVKNGHVTDEVGLYKVLIGHLRELCGKTPAADFGPKGLKSLQARMVAGDSCRNYVNALTRRTKHLFKWAAAEELIPVETYTRLTVVSGLQKNRSAARETEPVQPVDDATVEATLPHLRTVIGAMVRFERLADMAKRLLQMHRELGGIAAKIGARNRCHARLPSLLAAERHPFPRAGSSGNRRSDGRTGAVRTSAESFAVVRVLAVPAARRYIGVGWGSTCDGVAQCANAGSPTNGFFEPDPTAGEAAGTAITADLVSATAVLTTTFTASSIGSLKGTSMRSSPCS